jgi:Protein of unknown function (DUF3037)
MPTPNSYDYAFIRVVPRVERDEFVNAGAIVFCRTRRFLRAAVALDEARLLALAPDLTELDRAAIRRHLEAIPRIAAGDPNAGPIARLPKPERFHWLVAPASAMIQSSPVHCGLTADPAAALDHLLATIVHPPAAHPPLVGKDELGD